LPANVCGWQARNFASVRPGIDIEITREALGVVA